jgi:hypothetical protein
MNKERIVGIVALAVILASLLGVQLGYAKTVASPGGVHVWALVQSASNPSGGCVDLGLSGGYGAVTILPGKGVWISLQHANPSSTYTVSVGYLQANGGCDGTWRSLGSVNTDSAGDGTLAQRLTLPSGHSYVFEFKDSTGNVVYATDALRL